MCLQLELFEGSMGCLGRGVVHRCLIAYGCHGADAVRARCTNPLMRTVHRVLDAHRFRARFPKGWGRCVPLHKFVRFLMRSPSPPPLGLPGREVELCPPPRDWCAPAPHKVKITAKKCTKGLNKVVGEACACHVDFRGKLSRVPCRSLTEAAALAAWFGLIFLS